MNKRVPAAVGLIVCGTVAALLGLRPMIDEGTCASGGPYVIANECPDAYAWLFWVMFAGIVVAIAGMIMLFLVSTFAAGFASLSLWLGVLGTAAFVKARSLDGDARLGLDIVGWVFVPMAVAGLLLAALIHRAGARAAAHGSGHSRVERR